LACPGRSLRQVTQRRSSRRQHAINAEKKKLIIRGGSIVRFRTVRWWRWGEPFNAVHLQKSVLLLYRQVVERFADDVHGPIADEEGVVAAIQW
jgi:hypothetical protein